MKTARIAIVMVLFNHTFRAETKILGNTEDVFKFFSDA